MDPGFARGDGGTMIVHAVHGIGAHGLIDTPQPGLGHNPHGQAAPLAAAVVRETVVKTRKRADADAADARPAAKEESAWLCHQIRSDRPPFVGNQTPDPRRLKLSSGHRDFDPISSFLGQCTTTTSETGNNPHTIKNLIVDHASRPTSSSSSSLLHGSRDHRYPQGPPPPPHLTHTLHPLGDSEEPILASCRESTKKIQLSQSPLRTPPLLPPVDNSRPLLGLRPPTVYSHSISHQSLINAASPRRLVGAATTKISTRPPAVFDKSSARLALSYLADEVDFDSLPLPSGLVVEQSISLPIPSHTALDLDRPISFRASSPTSVIHPPPWSPTYNDSNMSRRVDTLGGPSEPPQWATDFSGSEMRGPGESSTLSHVPRAASDITPSVPMASHLSGDSIPSAYSESFTIRRHPPDRVVSGQFYALETDPEPESGELLRESPLHSPVESLERDSDGENDNGQRKKKRTRVLMTHQQQATLSKLWRATKFPGTGEREAVAKQVGLTGRQVQVWFQNRRQTFRKQIATHTVPDNSDPADYADLQSSPRSRRLTLEATKAADRDRVTAWAAESGAATGYLGVSLEEGADRASDVDEDGEEPDWSLSQSASHAESSRRLSRSDRPNRASTMWELDEDERLQAFSHPHRHPQPSPHRLSPKSSTRRESNLHGPLDAPVSCRPLAGRSGGAFQSYARSPSLNDPWTLRPSPQSVTSPLSPALPPLPHHSHSAPNPTKKDSLPQLNNHSRPQSFDGTRPSELPPSLVNLTLTGPMAHEVAGGRSRDSFHSLAVHHYDHVPSRSGSLTTSSPAMPGYHPEPELSRSRTDSARTSRTGPLTESHSSRDWFRSSLNSDRKWSEGSVMMSQDGDINMSARGVQPDQAFKCQSGPTIASVGADGTHQIMSKFAQSPVDLEMRKSSDTKPTQYRSQPGSPLKHLGSRNEATSNKRKSFEMPLPPSNNGVWDRLTSASLPSNRSEGERAQQLNTVSESSAKRDLPSFRDMFR